MTRDEALNLYASKWWEGKSATELARFQLNETRLCMPWEVFEKAVSEALGCGFADLFIPNMITSQIEAKANATTKSPDV